MKKILSLPKVLLIALIRRPRLLMTIGVLLACVLIWFGGPFVGMFDEKIRFAVLGGLLVLWIVYLCIERIRANRRASQIERYLRDQGMTQLNHTSQEKLSNVRDIQQQFNEAISILKRSKLGKGYHSRSALYALPWYMIIGPPAVGKSTAIEYSGLTFLNNQDGKDHKIRGVGGTRNCDFWFTDHGILLDTAGRFTVGAAKEDRQEWEDFLGLLRKERKKQPINGVIIAYSLADFLKKPPEIVQEEANIIRIRLEEVISKLGVIIPVYLMLTKCDLVEGFVEFFHHYSEKERKQIWGVTFPRHREEGDSPRLRVEKEFDELFQRLLAHSASGILQAGGKDRGKAFAFPHQWKLFKEAIGQFVEKVFQPGTLQDVPVFRGIYWTSGTQEGSPMDQLFSRFSNSLGIALKNETADFEGQSKSYFIKQLFADVVFPDCSLVKPSSKRYQQKEFARVAVAGCAVIGVGLSLFVLITSFGLNHNLLSDVAAEAQAVVQSTAVPNLDQNWGRFSGEVKSMDAMATRLKKIQRQTDRDFPVMLWGLYQGKRVYDPLRRIFLNKFSESFLLRSQNVLEQSLMAKVSGEHSEEESGFNWLKAYLMLGDPEHAVPEFLSPKLLQAWINHLEHSAGRQVLDVAGFRKGLENTLEFFSFHLLKDAQTEIKLNEGLVYKVQRELVGDSLIRYLYHKARSRAGKGLPVYTVDTALQDHNKEILLGNYSLPGVFTLDGRTRWFDHALSATIAEFKDDRWVLGDDGMSLEDIRQKVNGSYLRDYKEAWLAFLDGLHIRPVSTYANLQRLLEVYAGEASPLVRLLHQVARQTGKTAERAEGESQNLFDQISSTLQARGAERDGGQIENWERIILPTFRPLHNILLDDEASKEQSPLRKYQTELSHLQETVLPFLRGEGSPGELVELTKGTIQEKTNDLTQPFFSTDRLIAGLGSNLKERVEDIFLDPVNATIRLAFARVGQSVNAEWESKIFPSCQRLVTGQYPFSPSGKSASLKEIKDFFSLKEGNLWAFYRQQIAPFVKEEEPSWKNRSWQQTINLGLSDEALQHLDVAWEISKKGLFNISESEVEIPFEMSTPTIHAPDGIYVPEVVLRIGGNKYPYRRTKPETMSLSWPGKAPSSGAALAVYWIDRNAIFDTNRKLHLIREEGEGDFGFFKLLNRADVEVIDDNQKTQLRANWVVETSEGRPIQLQYLMRQQTTANPFAKEFFSRFHCVKRLIPT